MICNEESPHADTQEDVLNCKSLNQTHGEITPNMNFMYSDIKQQLKISQNFINLMREINQILEPQEEEEDIRNTK